ncbi:hypothetical protein ACI2I2_02880 [Scandinavium sp. NPDC088450]|uniref:hypothetical protein n=1 Tax=Scandinavium sp. NPDC088450 TaxID=3364514 RepID=UPI00384B51D9
MIHESGYWKDDLLKTADRLELRLVQTRWGEKNLYTIEKEVFIGFYSVRKLIESKKISDSIKTKLYNVKEFPYNGNINTIATWFKAEDYSFDQAIPSKINIVSLCNQFIHSHHFLPFLPNGKNLIGFFFCSDLKRTSGLYFITLFDVVDIFRTIGRNYPSSMQMTRTQSGKVHIKIK